MNHIFRRVFVGAILLAVVSHWVSAQAPQQGTPASSIGTRVVVIDIAKIFDQHPGFQQSMEAMKNEVQQVEQGFRERSQQIDTLRERMKQYESGKPEYKQLDSQILKIQADGQVEATQKKKEFLEREAQLYFNVYKEIQAEVKTFARMNGIGLVLRYNSAEMEPTRGSTLEGVNNNVVFQDRSDITQPILEQISRRYASRGAAAGAPVSR